MTQSFALLIDAYRELNARKMFWISLVISGIVVSALLLIGIGEDRNFKLAFWTIPIPVPPGIELDLLLKGSFLTLGVQIWLTWAAAILALISTASIFPDFLAGGSIDLILSKPIGRIRLFVTKYLGALLFVALQVAIFSLAAFLIIGVRAGAWEPGIFLAIPLVVIFFSYLFCICVLVGVVTRSTLASLLITILFWLMLFALNFGDELLMMPRVQHEIYVEKLQQRATQSDLEAPARATELGDHETELAKAVEKRDALRKWHGLMVTVKTGLPKTSETIGLLERWLIESVDLPGADERDQPDLPFMSREMVRAGVRTSEVVQRIQEDYRGRSVAWVLGTSLAFEAVVLALACFIFVRRDY